MKTEIRQVVEYTYTCDYCGRQFTSQGGWAFDAVKKCEAECAAALANGMKRIFLPPPGRWDSMFTDHHWRFVPIGSPEEECAKKGHAERRVWEPALSRFYYDERLRKDIEIPCEVEIVYCLVCGRRARDFQGRTRDAKKPLDKYE